MPFYDCAIVSSLTNLSLGQKRLTIRGALSTREQGSLEQQSIGATYSNLTTAVSDDTTARRDLSAHILFYLFYHPVPQSPQSSLDNASINVLWTFYDIIKPRTRANAWSH